MSFELVGGRDRDGTDFMQCQHGEPELIVAFEHDHNAVAFFDAEGGKVVGGAVGSMLHFFIGEAAFHMVFVHMEHSQFGRIFIGDFVHDIEGKVEAFFVDKVDGFQTTFFIFHAADKFIGNEGFGLVGGNESFAYHAFFGFFAGENHGAEYAIFTIYGDHAVGKMGMVVDGVPGAEDLGFFTDLDLEVTADHIVKFLPFVGGEVDGAFLFFLFVFIAYPVGFGDFVAETGGEVYDLDAVFINGGLTFAASCYGVAAEFCGAPFEQVGNFQAEGKGAFVDEREGKILLTFFIDALLRGSGVGLHRHFFNGEITNFAHFADTGRDLC